MGRTAADPEHPTIWQGADPWHTATAKATMTMATNALRLAQKTATANALCVSTARTHEIGIPTDISAPTYHCCKRCHCNGNNNDDNSDKSGNGDDDDVNGKEDDEDENEGEDEDEDEGEDEDDNKDKDEDKNKDKNKEKAHN